MIKKFKKERKGCRKTKKGGNERMERKVRTMFIHIHTNMDGGIIGQGGLAPPNFFCI